MRLAQGVLLIGCLLLVGAPAALGGPGATPVWEPATLSASGRYVLTRNVVTTVNPVITITANDVHLDLNGFTIEGSADVFASDVVLVQGSTGVTIENGTIIGGGAGVRLDSGSGQFTLRRLNIRDGRTGIGTAAGNSRGQIVDNLIENIGDEGISASGSAIQVRNNLVSADGKGIKVDNCESCQIVSNTVQDASDAGITLEGSNGVLIRDNTVSGGDVGIRVGQGGYHHVEGNVCTGNASFGLYFKSTSFSCVYRRNTARNNAGSGCAGPTTADFCDEGSGNTSHGDNYLPDLR